MVEKNKLPYFNMDFASLYPTTMKIKLSMKNLRRKIKIKKIWK